jgi:hypothetical protein
MGRIRKKSFMRKNQPQGWFFQNAARRLLYDGVIRVKKQPNFDSWAACVNTVC